MKFEKKKFEATKGNIFLLSLFNNLFRIKHLKSFF